MKSTGLFLVSATLALSGCASFETYPAAAVVDRDGFVARLPDTVFVAPPLASGQSLERFEAGLSSLGADAKLAQLPEGAVTPVIRLTPPSTSPVDMSRLESGSASADFLVLVNSAGQLEAIYCYQSTDPAIEQSAATLLGRTRFTPAKVNGVSVPVVMAMPVTFRLDGRSAHPVVLDLGAQVGPMTGPLPRGS